MKTTRSLERCAASFLLPIVAVLSVLMLPLVAQGQWSLTHILDDPTVTTEDIFGYSLSIDGNHIVIGALLDDTNGIDVGQAHLFDATTGALIRTFDDPNPTTGDQFGRAVTISGNRLLISDSKDDSSGPNTGKVHLFEADTGLLVRTFDNPFPIAGDLFGIALALDGDNLLIGAPANPNAGRAYLFDITTGDLLQIFDNPTPVVGDLFGSTVAIEGNNVVIGAWRDDSNGEDVGQAYLFDAASGSLLRTFDDPTPTEIDGFGESLAIRGNIVVISDGRDDTNGANVGQVHIFDLTTGILVRTFNDPTPTTEDKFGSFVSISGNKLLIGAQWDDTNGANVGQAHLFDVASGELVWTFDDPTPTGEDDFGVKVAAIDNNRVLIGASADDTNGTNVGQAYLFSFDDTDSNILVYQYTAQVKATDWDENEESNNTRETVRAYIIYDTETGGYTVVNYYTENGNKLYSYDARYKVFSQAFLTKDSRGRDNLVISLEGPGDQWALGTDYAQLDTLRGRAKRLRFRVAGETLAVDDTATHLKGACRYEEVDTTPDAESRYAEEGKVRMRFNRKLSILANDPDEGGNLIYGRNTVIDYLESKGYVAD